MRKKLMKQSYEFLERKRIFIARFGNGGKICTFEKNYFK